MVNGNVHKHHETGIAVVNSKLGWLVNGTVGDDRREINVNLVNSHVMKIECQRSEDKSLSDQINNFWSLDAVGIAENEISIYENFTRKIEFKDGRYSVELPVKESHPVLPNYTLCKKRLENLKRRLDDDEELKRKYEKVFKEQLDCGIIERTEYIIYI